MFFGRYIAIVAQLAIAGSLLAKKRVNESIGTLENRQCNYL
ncbi:MAG: potassium-transporting ATPase subunit KdpA [Mediterraneibacter gnavus]